MERLRATLAVLMCASFLSPSAPTALGEPTPPAANQGLAVTADFRRVLGEAVAKTIGSNNLDLVFPGARLQPDRFLSLI